MSQKYFIAYCSEITLTAALNQHTFTQILNQSIKIIPALVSLVFCCMMPVSFFSILKAMS